MAMRNVTSRYATAVSAKTCNQLYVTSRFEKLLSHPPEDLTVGTKSNAQPIRRTGK
jgi:hypothetical protein